MKRKFVKTVSALCMLAVIMGCSVDNKGENSVKGVNAGEKPSLTAVQDTAVTPTAAPTEVVEPETCCETVSVIGVADESNPENWFAINEIEDDLFKRIYGKSFKANCTVPREDLRYLTVAHYTGNGDEVKKGELICHRLIADDMIDIFHNLYAAKYPIERLELVDNYDADDRKSMTANNTSCFNFRVVAGSKNLSNHALGLAIDINPLYNPYVKKQKDGSLYVSPKNGTPYAKRSGNFKYKIDENDLAYKEFIKHGFTWGGHWKTMQDYQHFEKKIPGLKY